MSAACPDVPIRWLQRLPPKRDPWLQPQEDLVGADSVYERRSPWRSGPRGEAAFHTYCPTNVIDRTSRSAVTENVTQSFRLLSAIGLT